MFLSSPFWWLVALGMLLLVLRGVELLPAVGSRKLSGARMWGAQGLLVSIGAIISGADFLRQAHTHTPGFHSMGVVLIVLGLLTMIGSVVVLSIEFCAHRGRRRVVDLRVPLEILPLLVSWATHSVHLMTEYVDEAGLPHFSSQYVKSMQAFAGFCCVLHAILVSSRWVQLLRSGRMNGLPVGTDKHTHMWIWTASILLSYLGVGVFGAVYLPLLVDALEHDIDLLLVVSFADLVTTWMALLLLLYCLQHALLEPRLQTLPPRETSTSSSLQVPLLSIDSAASSSDVPPSHVGRTDSDAEPRSTKLLFPGFLLISSMFVIVLALVGAISCSGYFSATVFVAAGCAILPLAIGGVVFICYTASVAWRGRTYNDKLTGTVAENTNRPKRLLAQQAIVAANSFANFAYFTYVLVYDMHAGFPRAGMKFIVGFILLAAVAAMCVSFTTFFEGTACLVQGDLHFRGATLAKALKLAAKVLLLLIARPAKANNSPQSGGQKFKKLQGNVIVALIAITCSVLAVITFVRVVPLLLHPHQFPALAQSLRRPRLFVMAHLMGYVYMAVATALLVAVGHANVTAICDGDGQNCSYSAPRFASFVLYFFVSFVAVAYSVNEGAVLLNHMYRARWVTVQAQENEEKNRQEKGAAKTEEDTTTPTTPPSHVSDVLRIDLTVVVASLITLLGYVIAHTEGKMQLSLGLCVLVLCPIWLRSLAFRVAV